jgi:uncharacterized protein YceH (UPF0502 family)
LVEKRWIEVDFQLSDIEARILGCLIEKASTTPEYYPLTLNSLTTACNQKSNRHPMVVFEETTVVRGLDTLQTRGMVVRSEGGGSIVPKYRHVLPEKLPLDDGELAIVCELMLRGPQTPGELNSRTARMFQFADLDALKMSLTALENRDDPVVMELPRETGRKETRHGHLLCGTPEIDDTPAGAKPEAAAIKVQAENERIAALEEEVAALRAEVDELGRAFAHFKTQFD